MPQVLAENKCCLRDRLKFLACNIAIAARFFQGFAIRAPEQAALSTLFNAILSVLSLESEQNTQNAAILAMVLANIDAVNQGLVLFISEAIKYYAPPENKKKPEGSAPAIIEPAPNNNIKAMATFCLFATLLMNACLAYIGAVDFTNAETNNSNQTLALAMGIVIAVFASPSAAYYTYKRANQIDADLSAKGASCWPGRRRTQAYFGTNILVGNVLGAVMNYYQFYRSLNTMMPKLAAIILAAVLTLMSIVSSNYVQMRMWGFDLVEAEKLLPAPAAAPLLKNKKTESTPLLLPPEENKAITVLAEAPAAKPSFRFYWCRLSSKNKTLSFFSIALLLFIKSMNWFNVISGLAMFNIVLAQIPGYSKEQSNLYLSIFIGLVAMYGGGINANLMSKLRINATIVEFFMRTGLVLPIEKSAVPAPRVVQQLSGTMPLAAVIIDSGQSASGVVAVETRSIN